MFCNNVGVVIGRQVGEKKMRMRFVVFLVVCAMASLVKAETMGWSFSGNLGVSADSGTVYLYKDGGTAGWGSGFTIGSGDVATGVTTPVVADLGHGGLWNWGDSFSWPSGALADGDKVYSVLFNSGATQYRIIDSSTFTLPPNLDGPATYNLTSIGGGSWIAVPEPTTLALIGLGAVTILIGRRRSDRKSVS